LENRKIPERLMNHWQRGGQWIKVAQENLKKKKKPPKQATNQKTHTQKLTKKTNHPKETPHFKPRPWEEVVARCKKKRQWLEKKSKPSRDKRGCPR